jgi:hypothetical protein
MELSSVQGTLAVANNEYSEQRVTFGSLCDTLGVVSARAQEVSVRERLSHCISVSIMRSPSAGLIMRLT